MTKKPPNTSSTAALDLERLAEIIISALKELSTTRQALTPTSLSKSLIPNREIIHRLTRSPAESAVQLSGSKGSSAPQEQDSEERFRRAHESERQLVRQVEDLQKEVDQLSEFYRRATLSMIVLASDSQSGDTAAHLSRFRTLVSNNAPVIEQERCLDDLKTTILTEQREETAGSENETSKAPSFWSSWRKRTESDKKSLAEETSAYLPLLQNSLASIMDQFQTRPGDQHHHLFEELQQRFRSCSDPIILAASSDELAQLIRSYLDTAIEERQQISQFVGELRGNFLELEAQLLASLTDTQDSQQADQEFNQTLRVQVDEVRETVSISKTIEEVRGLVSAKLQAIKFALTEKRKKDEARIQQSNLKMDELQQHLRNMKSEINQIQERTKSLEQEALLDSLTNISNRRAYEIRVDEELQRYKRYNHLFSLVMFDVDHFKAVNDEFGHRTGDKCLCEIVNRVRSSLRKVDFLARYGGEEFVAILPGTTRQNASLVAEKLRVQIERTAFLFQGKRVPVTISLGVTQVQSSDIEPQAIFARADEAMYEAKREGRNRVGMR
jgi:diguanylate cyclase